MNLRILALITARGGSKRLPGKNLRLLRGRPLILWTIDVAKRVPGICDILVSTDDPAIADVARSAGALLPWLRPSHLATDTATSVDVAIHALDKYESANGSVEGLLLLQPTSPFRTAKTIANAIALFEKTQGRYPVVSVSPADCHPAWCFRLSGSRMEPFVDWGGITRHSQELEPVYKLNGAVYVASPKTLRERRSFVTPDTQALVVEDPVEGIDIDTSIDWALAEAVPLCPR